MTEEINPNRDGKFIIVCQCGHEHCRVCKNGRVTDFRWDSRDVVSNVIPTARKYTQHQLKRDSFLGEAWLRAGA